VRKTLQNAENTIKIKDLQNSAKTFLPIHHHPDGTIALVAYSF
jgi:hypothetical protein